MIYSHHYLLKNKLHWIYPNQMDSGQILSQYEIAYRGVSKSLSASSYEIPQHSFFKDNDLGAVLPVAKNVILHVMMGNEF